MPDSCDCINIKVNVSLKEPKLNGKLDPKCETILCSDGEDYKRGYEEGHEKGYADGEKVGYDNGYNKGYTDCKAEGDSFYDSFWDHYQQNGERITYSEWFNGEKFSAKTFYPKYDIRPRRAQYSSLGGVGKMFCDFSDELDLIQRFKDCNVVLDTSAVDDAYQMFYCADGITTIPTLDFSQVTRIQDCFNGCRTLHTIEKIILSSKLTSAFNAFLYCYELKNIIFEGEIATDISFASSSKLSMASVDSIGSCCIDLTGQTAKTITFHKDVIAKMSDEQKAVFTNKNWTIVSKG